MATVYPSRSGACDAIVANNSEAVPDETVSADRRYVSSKLMPMPPVDNNVRGVGQGSCGTLPVVVVYAKNQSAEVPAYGPGGTPVMAYVQREFVAF